MISTASFAGAVGMVLGSTARLTALLDGTWEGSACVGTVLLLVEGGRGLLLLVDGIVLG
jgi:hypothetical protein